MIKFEGNNKKILSKQIVEDILSDIKNKKIGPGDKLLTEKELVKKYDVSRNSVREALRTLDIMNVIEIQQGKGAFITSLETELLMEHLDFVFTIDRDTEIQALLDARMILEPEIAAIAAEKITDEELLKIKSLNNTYSENDHMIHKLIAESTNNPILIKFITSIWTLGEISRKKTSVINGVKSETHNDLNLIIKALEDRNPDMAKKYMRKHIEYIKNQYIKNKD